MLIDKKELIEALAAYGLEEKHVNLLIKNKKIVESLKVSHKTRLYDLDQVVQDLDLTLVETGEEK